MRPVRTAQEIAGSAEPAGKCAFIQARPAQGFQSREPLKLASNDRLAVLRREASPPTASNSGSQSGGSCSSGRLGKYGKSLFAYAEPVSTAQCLPQGAR